MSFSTIHPMIKPATNWRSFYVMDDLTYTNDLYGIFVRVPYGFRTNLLSSGRILWSIMPSLGRYSTAAIFHDYLYSEDAVYYHNGVKKKPDRWTADHIFLNVMCTELGVKPWKIKVFGVMLGLFGRFHFKG